MKAGSRRLLALRGTCCALITCLALTSVQNALHKRGDVESDIILLAYLNDMLLIMSHRSPCGPKRLRAPIDELRCIQLREFTSQALVNPVSRLAECLRKR